MQVNSEPTESSPPQSTRNHDVLEDINLDRNARIPKASVIGKKKPATINVMPRME